MTILVTGAAGFIGSKLVETLRNDGEEVEALDNFNDYYSVEMKSLRAKNLKNLFEVQVQNIDLCNVNDFKRIVEKVQPTSIIHLAAQAGIRLPLERSGEYVQSNLVGFSNFLKVSVEQEIPNLLYASSSSVYGNSTETPYKESNCFLKPVSFYGATKLANELLAPTLVEGSSSRVRGLRFFTVYGPWGRPDMAYSRLVNAAVNNLEFNMYGNGAVTRDFTFIDDAVESVKLLEKELHLHKMGFSDVVNVGGGKPSALLEMIEVIEKLTNRTINVNILEKHKLDIQNTESDSTYLESLTGYVPRTTLQDGLRSVVAWANSKEISSNLPRWIKSTV